MPLRVAFLSDGKVFLADGQSAPRLIDSPFAQDLLDRRERTRQRYDWKEEGMAWQFSLMGVRPPSADGARPIRFRTLTTGGDKGEILYAIDTGAVGGLFLWDPADESEKRLIHRAGFRVRDVARHRVHGTFALSVETSDGAANLALLEPTGRGLREITEGDSLDECPAWAPGDGKELVYQSAGVGRNQAGVPVGMGPYALFRLDLDSGKMTTLAEDDQYDFLCPRLAADGSLYFIRRPYQPAGHVEVSPWKLAKDIVFFPFRLIAAFVHFFNWFSLVFRRKPLLTAGGPRREGPDSRYMMLWGKLIDAEKAIKATPDTPAALVPATWQLIRRRPDGVEEVLAKSVLSFDLTLDGQVVYTNGNTVAVLDPTGPREFCQSRMIERVVVAAR